MPHHNRRFSAPLRPLQVFSVALLRQLPLQQACSEPFSRPLNQLLLLLQRDQDFSASELLNRRPQHQPQLLHLLRSAPHFLLQKVCLSTYRYLASLVIYNFFVIVAFSIAATTAPGTSAPNLFGTPQTVTTAAVTTAPTQNLFGSTLATTTAAPSLNLFGTAATTLPVAPTLPQTASLG